MCKRRYKAKRITFTDVPNARRFKIQDYARAHGHFPFICRLTSRLNTKPLFESIGGSPPLTQPQGRRPSLRTKTTPNMFHSVTSSDPEAHTEGSDDELLEEHACISCHGVIDGACVGCDGPCAGWVHLSCAGLTQQQADSAVAYKCPGCKAPARRISEWPGLEQRCSHPKIPGPLDMLSPLHEEETVFEFTSESDSEVEEDAEGSDEGDEDSGSEDSLDGPNNELKFAPLKIFERPLICGELATQNFHCSLRERESKKQKLEQRTTNGGKSSSREKAGGERPNIPGETTVFLRAVFVRMLPLRNVAANLFSATESKSMSKITGLSSAKIVRWFANNRKRYFEAHEAELLQYAKIRLVHRGEIDGRVCSVLENAMAKRMWPKKYDEPSQEDAALLRRLIAPTSRD
jgi:hypothetical protein